MPTNITATDVVNDWGGYYRNEGQGTNDVHDMLREQFNTMNAFTVIETDETLLKTSNVEYAEVLQAFQQTFTPKGGVTFTPKEIQLFNVKTDQLFYPDALKDSWLGFLTLKKLDRTTWPFVRWFVEVYLTGQVKHDLERNFYGAVRVAPTNGTAGAASASFNGLKKIINDGITGTTIVPIVTGAPNATATTWCTQVETFVKGLPELYWGMDMEIMMSRALALRYVEGRRTKYNSNYSQVSEKKAVQDFENITVNGYGSFAGRNKILLAPKINKILAFKGNGNMGTFELEKVDRQVKVYSDFYIGVGFNQDSLLWTNDQDLS